MNLLEKAREYQKAVNIAMSEYEEAKKAYDEMSNVESCFYVKVNNTNMDLHEWDESINDLTDSIVQSFTTRRKNALEASERRLAVLIGDKEIFVPQDSVFDTQRHENDKSVEELHTSEENTVETQNTESKQDDYKPWHDEKLLRKELVENGLGVGEFAKKYDCKKSDVYNGKSKYGINTTTVQKSTPSSAKR